MTNHVTFTAIIFLCHEKRDSMSFAEEIKNSSDIDVFLITDTD